MSLEADAQAFALRAGSTTEKRDRNLRWLLGRERAIVDAYRSLFLTGGEFSPAAMIVLDDLASKARLTRDMSHAPADGLRVQAAQRAMVQHIFGRFELDERRMARLAKQLSDRVPPSQRFSMQAGESE